MIAQQDSKQLQTMLKDRSSSAEKATQYVDLAIALMCRRSERLKS